MKTAISIVALILLCIFPLRAHAESKGPEFSPEVLSGTKRIVVFSSFAGQSSKVSAINHPIIPSIRAVLTEEFLDLPEIEIASHAEAAPEEILSRDTLVFFFTVSSFQDDSGREIAALTLQLRKYVEQGKYSAVANHNPAYVFLVPQNEADLNKEIGKGTRFLTAHLPSYFCEAKYFEGNFKKVASCPPSKVPYAER